MKQIKSHEFQMEVLESKIPVLVDETNTVVWLGDYGTNQPFVPCDDTNKILMITQL